MKTDVLIVGSGPTGLVLALWLRRLGVQVRIIDRSDGPGETSRALAVQARTLEFHRQIGIVDDVLAAGVRVEQLTVRTPAGIAAELHLNEFGRGVSPYSYAFALPQDVHERILIEHLEKAGVSVERHTELTGFTQDADGVTATLDCNGKIETLRVAYLGGADGTHSAVRHGLHIGFPGGAYEQSFYVADVEGKGAVTRNGMDVTVSEYGFAIVMPVRQLGSLRLIGVVPKAHEADDTITFEAIRADVERDTGISVSQINWFSTYRVHHRVADRFQVGRVFLAGDAGHIHSPAGGQGMNTGMGDAVNLAWKIAAVLQGRADSALLDSYEPERIAFARLLIKSTDQAFRVVTNRSRFFGIFRRYLMPRIMARVLSTRLGSRAFFGLISQTRINYRGSSVSGSNSGKVQGGDRLPYVVYPTGNNFDPLQSLDWQVHVYGDVDPALSSTLAGHGLELHGFPWSREAEDTHLIRNAAYLVRPDGHIALVADDQKLEALEQYLSAWKIRSRKSASNDDAAQHGDKSRAKLRSVV